MGSSSSSERVEEFQAPNPTKLVTPQWTGEAADGLQEAVDRVFGHTGKTLHGFQFSFSIADPLLDGCPLIGCSTGFTKLCGYELQEIVGRNCRFLVDAVPAHLIDKRMRRQTRDFCEAVKLGREYWRPPSEYETWMPQGRPSDEFLAMQTNARKNGSLFNNMFFMKVFDISADLGEERPYIIALQSELPEGKEDLKLLAKNLEQLDANMAQVQKELATSFFMQTSIARQLHVSQCAAATKLEDAKSNSTSCVAPENLHTAFPASEVRSWSEGTFKHVKKLADATRNGGVVLLMQDKQSNDYVAVKQMPNKWMRESHEEFIRVHPRESELPWQDIGCTQFLNSVNYKYACRLFGVFRNDLDTFVVSSFASEGDLFNAAEAGEPAGIKREAEFLPLVTELLSALRDLHDMQIVHRDISLENVLRTKDQDGKFTIKIIDFGMASTGRIFRSCARGKASYEAPEMQSDGEYDAFLSDTFAAGVVVYGILLKDYPWQSTKPGRCKCFDYVKKEGFRAYCEKRCVRGSKTKIATCVSKPLLDLLTGMLMLNPERRLTLGEKQWTDKRSVWDEPWISKSL